MSGFIPLAVPNFGAREAELAGLAITSGWVSTSGGKVTEFEEKLAAYVGMPRAVACNAGTSALHLAATMCIRDRLRDGHQHPEAPRPRPHGSGGAVYV